MIAPQYVPSALDDDDDDEDEDEDEDENDDDDDKLINIGTFNVHELF